VSLDLLKLFESLQVKEDQSPFPRPQEQQLISREDQNRKHIRLVNVALASDIQSVLLSTEVYLPNLDRVKGSGHEKPIILGDLDVSDCLLVSFQLA